jgi:hypothetical protein
MMPAQTRQKSRYESSGPRPKAEYVSQKLELKRHPQYIIVGWRYNLHAGSERKDERNIPNIDENNENTRHVAD